MFFMDTGQQEDFENYNPNKLPVPDVAYADLGKDTDLDMGMLFGGYTASLLE
jgi:hypothetical protein